MATHRSQPDISVGQRVACLRADVILMQNSLPVVTLLPRTQTLIFWKQVSILPMGESDMAVHFGVARSNCRISHRVNCFIWERRCSCPWDPKSRFHTTTFRSSALSAFSGYEFRVVLVGSQRRGLFHRLQRRKTTGHVKLQGGETLSSSSTSEFVLRQHTKVCNFVRAVRVTRRVHCTLYCMHWPCGRSRFSHHSHSFLFPAKVQLGALQITITREWLGRFE